MTGLDVPSVQLTVAEARRVSVALATLAGRLEDIERAAARDRAERHVTLVLDWPAMTAAGLDVRRVLRDEADPTMFLSSGRGGVRVTFGQQPEPEGICEPGVHPEWSAQTSRPLPDGTTETDAAMWFEPGDIDGLLGHVRSELGG